MPWPVLAVVGGKQLRGHLGLKASARGPSGQAEGVCSDAHSGLARGTWALGSDSRLLELGDLVQSPPDTDEGAEAPRRRSQEDRELPDVHP